MKRLLIVILVLALLAAAAVVLAPRILTNQIIVSIKEVRVSLGDAEGNPLGVDFRPFALRQSLDSFGDLYFTIFATLEIENHGPIAYDMRGMDYTAELSIVEPISTQPSTRDTRIELPANGTVELEIDMKIPIGDVVDSLGALAAIRRANLVVNGELILDLWVGSKRVPFEHERMVGLPAIRVPDLPDLPDINLPDLPSMPRMPNFDLPGVF